MDLQQIKQRVEAIPWEKIATVLFLAVCVAACIIVAYKIIRPAQNPSTAPEIAPEALKAADVPKSMVNGPKRLEVYDKRQLDKKVPLPVEVRDNSNIQATTTADIKPSPYGGTAVAYTNISTGKSGISYQAKPRPWYELGGQTAIGAGIGISTYGGQAGAVRIRQDVLRLWSATVSAEAEARMNTIGPAEARAMVWAEHRF